MQGIESHGRIDVLALDEVVEYDAQLQPGLRLLRGQGEAAALAAIDQVAINPNTLAVLQLRALQDVAAAPNSKVVVPYSAAGLVGNTEVLLQALRGAGAVGNAVSNGSRSAGNG